MASSFTIQSLQDLLTFPFKTSDGRKKLFLAGLLGLGSIIIPILPTLFLIGYGGLIMQRMILEKSEPFLPEWNDWDKILKLGLKLFGAGFIYSFPALVMILIGYMSMMAPAFLMPFFSPHSNQAAYQLIGVSLVGTFGGMACIGIGLLLTLPLLAIYPVLMGHVAATNSFSAAFHIKDWWKILRANLGGFLVTIILLGGLYMILVFTAQILYLTIVLCIIVPFLLAFTSGYLLIMANVLFAQAYREAVGKLASQVV